MERKRNQRNQNTTSKENFLSRRRYDQLIYLISCIYLYTKIYNATQEMPERHLTEHMFHHFVRLDEINRCSYHVLKT